ncbi:MlaD family protein [Rhodococcus sp. IEGM 1379]|uniref:MlaD family protein n=1 Tax=Rhodococcus sp. IEGM 1379 TaxID=3047086 RepID=UPI0024B70BF2|nr:MlaD family protein [Rhodococcus sp. IEGM 1379]MDI9916534.1 MlaD family protein [Rhodococcus sp. IEGM 1379]
MKRLALVQLVLFAITAIVVIPFGIVYVVGPQGLGDHIRLHASMSDAFGLTKGTGVTYRGVQVGKVSDVALDPSTRSARIELSLGGDTEIPSDSIAKVTMGSAAGIQNVDIYPQADRGPYLEDGDEIAMPADQQPVQMSQLMLQASDVLEGIDPQAISDIGTELDKSFNGLGPSLRTMIDNGGTLSAQLNDQSTELAALLSRTSTLVDSMAGQSDSFVRGMSAAKNFTQQLDSNAPVLIYLTDHSPAALTSAQQLFDKYHNTFGAVLANLVAVAPIIADRTNALETGLVTIPEGLAKLASIVNGDRADFALVATQGPVCNYDTPRHEVGDLSPASPSLALYCPPGNDLVQRGAQNAPRPDNLGLQNSTIPGTPIGPPIVPDPILIPTGVDALNYWRMMLEGLGNGPR